MHLALASVVLVTFIVLLHYKYSLLWLGDSGGIFGFWSSWSDNSGAVRLSKVAFVVSILAVLLAPWLGAPKIFFAIGFGALAIHLITFAVVSQ